MELRNELPLDEGIRVKRDEIIELLRANRDKHRAVFEEALSGWHEAVIAALALAVKEAKAGLHYRTSFALPQPQDHTSDYDRVIRMLELSQDEVLILNQREVSWYIQDDWGWKGDFIATSSNYTNNAR